MKVGYHKKFFKDLNALPSGYKERIEEFVFEILPALEEVKAIPGAERMKGYNNYYKIRFGDYRLGFRVEDKIIVLERVLHRKEVYRYFPI